MDHAKWLTEHTRSVLADVTITVMANRAQERDDIPVKLTIKAIELNYGPCIHFEATVDVGFVPKGWHWDDHPFRGATKDSDTHEPENSSAAGVTSISDIVDDTPAVRALITEVANPMPPKLYVGTECTHRARLLSAIRSFWA